MVSSERFLCLQYYWTKYVQNAFGPVSSPWFLKPSGQIRAQNRWILSPVDYSLGKRYQNLKETQRFVFVLLLNGYLSEEYFCLTQAELKFYFETSFTLEKENINIIRAELKIDLRLSCSTKEPFTPLVFF